MPRLVALPCVGALCEEADIVRDSHTWPVSRSGPENEKALVLRRGDGFMRWPSGSGTSGPPPERGGKKTTLKRHPKTERSSPPPGGAERCETLLVVCRNRETKDTRRCPKITC